MFFENSSHAVNANDLHFGFEIDATLARGGGLDFLDEGENFLSGRSAVIDDEVAMHFGNARPSYGEVLEAELLDQSSSGSLIGILENATRACRNGLGFAALAFRFGDSGFNFLGVSESSAQRGRKSIVLLEGRHIAVANFHFARGPRENIAVLVAIADGNDLVETSLRPSRRRSF